jgi:surface carbohydrate biosynthesis protein (TIGR04326 family)
MINMGGTILYIFDQSCNPERAVRHCAGKGIKKIFLCPVTTRQQTVSRVLEALAALAGCETEVLPYLKSFDKTAFCERDNFVQFVSGLGNEPVTSSGVRLKEYFRCPGSAFSTWWLSSIVEKDPVKSDVYHNLVRLLTILGLREDCATNALIIDTAFQKVSRALRANCAGLGYSCKDLNPQREKGETASFGISFLKGLRLYLYWIYKIIVALVYTGGLGSRKKILKKARYAAITYFPFVDKEALGQKRFIDKYYSSLQQMLEHRHKDEFIWFAMDSDTGGADFRKKASLGREVNRWGYPLYFIEEWIGLGGLFAVFVQYICCTARFLLKKSSFSRNVRYSKERIDIGPVLDEDWVTSFAGSVLMGGLIYYTAFRNISRRLKEGTVVTYPAENKGWERALNSALDEGNKIRSMAIIHTSVPLLALQFFDYPEDSKKDENGKLPLPNPDFLACNGRIPLELLKSSGWGGSRAFLWFALRYQHLGKQLQNNISWETRQNKILVALSYSIAESEELLHYIHQAFSVNTGYQIIIKGHYSLPLNSLIKRMNLEFNRETFVFSDKAIDRLLPQVKAMIVTGSSAALDSIAFGCPVIIPKLSSMVDMNPLSGISDFPVYTWSPGELKDMVDEIICRQEPLLRYDKCKKFIEDYFEFFNSEEELAERIEGRL